MNDIDVERYTRAILFMKATSVFEVFETGRQETAAQSHRILRS